VADDSAYLADDDEEEARRQRAEAVAFVGKGRPFMTVYFIGYNFARPGQNPKTLWDALTALGAKRVQEAVWIMRSSSTAAQIRDQLWQYIGVGGRLLVIESMEWAAWNPMSDVKSV